MSKRPPEFWILFFGGVLLTGIILVGQTLAVFDYALAVSIGLQEAAEEVTATGVAYNKGFSLGDTLVYLPLLVVGLTGLWFRKKWGLVVMSAALGITVYWPVFSLAALYFAQEVPGFGFTDYFTYTLVLVPITLFGLWGLWTLNSYYENFSGEKE